jgi:hypothetical protein
MVRLRQGVSCERVGDNWLVLGNRDGVVHNLTGQAATVIDCVTSGQPVPPDCDDAVATLVDTGILTPDTGWSRRKVLAAAGAAAAIGMVTLTLPTAAMAASVSPFGTVTATAGSNQVTLDWTAAASTSYQVVYKPTIGAGDYTTFGGPVSAGPVTVTGLTNDIEYSFKVQIVGSAPLTESAVVTATPGATSITDLGTTWTAIGTASGVAANTWRSVAHGNGIWVAVADGGDTDRAMRSINGGASWTPVGLAEGLTQNRWHSVAYGNGVWVAVAVAGGFDDFATGEVVMRSTTGGASWTAVDAPGEGAWNSVAYGNGVWVAVAYTGGDSQVMYSTTGGLSWLPVAAAEANEWQSVAYGNGVWVAVADGGTNRVMRSTNGATWNNTDITGVEPHTWRSVAYGNGVWVAVTDTVGVNQVMRSTNGGLSWLPVAAAEANTWRSVAYGNGVWVAVADGVPNRVMYSTDDGATWNNTNITGVEANAWRSVAYGNGRFVAVAQDGTERVMYSPSPAPPP